MISGKKRSKLVEGEFTLFGNLMLPKFDLKGDICLNKVISELVPVTQMGRINLNSVAFKNFAIKERDATIYDVERIIKSVRTFSTFETLEMDASYIVNGELKAAAELNGPHHYSRIVFGQDAYYTAIVHDYAKRRLFKQIGIPLFELRVEGDVISESEIKEVLSFFAK